MSLRVIKRTTDPNPTAWRIGSWCRSTASGTKLNKLVQTNNESQNDCYQDFDILNKCLTYSFIFLLVLCLHRKNIYYIAHCSDCLCVSRCKVSTANTVQIEVKSLPTHEEISNLTCWNNTIEYNTITWNSPHRGNSCDKYSWQLNYTKNQIQHIYGIKLT